MSHFESLPFRMEGHLLDEQLSQTLDNPNQYDHVLARLKIQKKLEYIKFSFTINFLLLLSSPYLLIYSDTTSKTLLSDFKNDKFQKIFFSVLPKVVK